MRRISALFAGALCATIGSALVAQTPPSRDDLDVVQVRPDVYMIAGAGGNVAAHIGPAGVVVVDSGSEPTAAAVLAAVRRLTARPIRYVINTSGDADHVGGNGVLSKAGQTILGFQGSSGVSEDVYTSGGAASVPAHENVFTRISGTSSVFPSSAWPTKTYTGRSLFDVSQRRRHPGSAHARRPLRR